jgi:iron(III) transport system permease protein
LAQVATAARPAPASRVSPLRIAAYVAAAIAIAPLVSVGVLALTRPADAAIPWTQIARYGLNTAVLGALVAIGTTVLGAVAAWLVVMHRFPGRAVFSWALAMPLAAPAFALAYGYADLLDVAGPVRTALRGAFGSEIWPFEVRSLPGAAFVLSFAFYPYVYLTARAAFVSQSVDALEAARTLGSTAAETFWRVALPLARPALAAGAALAVMEAFADYGAVSFLAVQTLTTGVVRAWSTYGAPGSAARLSLVLLGAAALLLWVERSGRQGHSATQSARWRALVEAPLPPIKAWGATLFCVALLIFGLILPAGWLAWRGLDAPPEVPRLARAAAVSFGLAGAGAALTVVLAGLIAFGAREGHWAKRIASLGYATPGAVMAVGLLAPASALWKSVGGVLMGTASSLALMLLAYSARLMASALGPLEAGLSRVTPSMDRAARTLGETEAGTLARVHAPMVRGAIWTAAILVFIDILKELPATLILRPFDFDTLAVLADRYAADERLAQAAWPALLIVAVAAVPTAILTRQVMRSRPGEVR